MKRFVAVAVGVFGALVVLEGWLRASWSPPILRTTPYQVADPVFGSALIPGAAGVIATVEYEHPFRITAQGLRGDEVFARERPEGTRGRVLFLGDSFTFGLGSADDETFVSRIDARWPDVEVANCGANGYGTREELAFLDTFGAAFRPDLTVLMFFWNDLEDNLEHDALCFEVGEDGVFHRVAPAGEVDPFAPRLVPQPVPIAQRGSYLGWFFKYGLRGLRYRYLGIKPRPIRTESDRSRAFAVFEELLVLMRHRAAELGTRLVVAAIPDHNQVDPEATIRNISALNFDVQGRLAAICARLELPFVDLLPGLRAEFERARVPLYYFADRHLTPEGNRVVAELLAPRLERLLAP